MPLTMKLKLLKKKPYKLHPAHNTTDHNMFYCAKEATRHRQGPSHFIHSICLQSLLMIDS